MVDAAHGFGARKGAVFAALPRSFSEIPEREKPAAVLVDCCGRGGVDIEFVAVSTMFHQTRYAYGLDAFGIVAFLIARQPAFEFPQAEG